MTRSRHLEESSQEAYGAEQYQELVLPRRETWGGGGGQTLGGDLGYIVTEMTTSLVFVDAARRAEGCHWSIPRAIQQSTTVTPWLDI